MGRKKNVKREWRKRWVEDVCESSGWWSMNRPKYICCFGDGFVCWFLLACWPAYPPFHIRNIPFRLKFSYYVLSFLIIIQCVYFMRYKKTSQCKTKLKRQHDMTWNYLYNTRKHTRVQQLEMSLLFNTKNVNQISLHLYVHICIYEKKATKK